MYLGRICLVAGGYNVQAMRSVVWMMSFGWSVGKDESSVMTDGEDRKSAKDGRHKDVDGK